MRDMLRRLIGRILRPSPVLAFFGILVSLIGGWQVMALLSSDARWDDLSGLSTGEQAGLLGLFLIGLLIARSLVSDVWNVLVQEQRIVCGSGQAGTSYDYSSLLSKNPKEVFVVAQNMRTLLSDPDYLPCISRWLGRNKDREPSLAFVLTTPEVLGALNPTAMEHLMQSVVQIKAFLDKESMRDRITVRFHPGAASLSAFVCDPKDRRRGTLVFTPKWALDSQPANRLYCVIERWEHNELFNRVAGTIPAMVQIDSASLNLGQVCGELGI